MSWEGECARDLILAIFRLAILDLQGLPYAGDGEPDGLGRPSRLHADSARAFLEGRYAGELAELIGLSGTEIARQASRLKPAASKATGVSTRLPARRVEADLERRAS